MRQPSNQNISTNEQKSYRRISNKKTAVASVVDTDANTFDCALTAVTTAAIKIELPDAAEKVRIKHNTSGGVVYLGKDLSVTTLTGYPLVYGEYLDIQLQAGNDNALYGITSTGTITVYAAGAIYE